MANGKHKTAYEKPPGRTKGQRSEAAHLFGVVIGAIFLTELGVMAVINFLLPSLAVPVSILAGSALAAAINLPILYLLFLRSMQRKFTQCKETVALLESTHAELNQVLIELKNHKNFSENLLHSSLLPTFVLDSTHRVIAWNRACEELTGIKALEVMGTNKHWQAFYQSERPCIGDLLINKELGNPHELYEHFKDVTALSGGLHGEAWFKSINGSNRYLLCDAAPIYDANGGLEAVIETLHDITERKLMERELRDNEERYRLLFDNAPMGIAVCDHEGSIINANSAIAKIAGAPSVQEILQVKAFEAQPLVLSGISEQVRKCMVTGQKLVTEHVYTSSWGASLYLRLHLNPIRDRDNKVTGVHALVEDFTDSKAAEEALRESEERYRDIFDNVHDFIQSVDLTGSIVYVNKSWERELGYEKEELIGRIIFDFMHSDYLATARNAFKRVFAGAEVKGVEIALIAKDGRVVPVEANGSVHFKDGRPVGTRSIFRDITDRKKAEQALVANNRKMREELELAAQVQRQLLPQKLPDTPEVSFVWKFKPCSYVAGDMFNVFSLDDEHIGFYILDVKGHGISAALNAVTLSCLLKPLIYAGTYSWNDEPNFKLDLFKPSQIIEHLNCRFTEERNNNNFFTIFYGVLDIKNLLLTYARAGHCPPVLMTKDGMASELVQGGPAVGLIREVCYQDYILELKGGDKLFLYTDGIIDVQNSKGIPLTKKGLINLIAGNKKLNISQLADKLLEEVLGYAGGLEIDDDITMLGIEVPPKGQKSV